MSPHKRAHYSLSVFFKKCTRILLYLLLIVVVSAFLLMLGMSLAVREDRLFSVTQNVIGKFERARIRLAESDVVSFNEYLQLTKYPDKIELPRPDITKDTIVAFVFGQSNAANQGGQKYTAINNNISNYWNGKYFLTSDPLLGSSGTAGSVWTLTANKLVSQNVAKNVIIIANAIGGSSVREWRRGGPYYEMLKSRLKEIKANHLPVTHFLWHQGEADNGTISASEYDEGMKEIIGLTKYYFPDSKFFVALATRCNRSHPISLSLQKAQSDLTAMEGVYRGPNTDNIGMEDRYDGCHFAASGLEKHSDGWVAAISHPVK